MQENEDSKHNTMNKFLLHLLCPPTLCLHTQNFKKGGTLQNIQVQLTHCNLPVKLLQHPALLSSNLRTNYWA